jgi:hypothetical protein
LQSRAELGVICELKEFGECPSTCVFLCLGWNESPAIEEPLCMGVLKDEAAKLLPWDLFLRSLQLQLPFDFGDGNIELNVGRLNLQPVGANPPRSCFDELCPITLQRLQISSDVGPGVVPRRSSPARQSSDVVNRYPAIIQ